MTDGAAIQRRNKDKVILVPVVLKAERSISLKITMFVIY